MNNQNHIDKFDAIFKDAAYDYELPYNKDVWNLMQKKLDNTQGNKKRYILLLTILFTTIGIASYVIVNKNANKSTSNQNNTTISSSTPNQITNNANTNANTNQITNHTTNELNKNNIDTKNRLSSENNLSNSSNNNIKSNIINSTKLASARGIEKKANPSIISSRTINNINLNKIYTEKNSHFNEIKIKNKELPFDSIDKTNVATAKILTKPSTLKNKVAVENKSVKKINTNQNQIPTNNLALNIPTNNKDQAPVTKNDINNSKAAEIKLEKIENVANQNNYSPLYSKQATNLYWMHNRYVTDFEKLALENATAIDRITKQLAYNEWVQHQTQQAETIKYLKIKRAFETPASRWFAMVAGAGNIGYVSNPQIGKTNFQYLFSLGYNISKHVSFQTGIVFSNKQFDVRNDQFDYQGPSIYNKYITNINSDISLIDIPITFRYQFSETENKGMFFTAGFSSLFMKKENYQVNLSSTSPAFIDQNFENTASRFTLLNLSVGYQYLLNKKISILFEPFIQLPFDNIGKGNIKMSSLGLQIGAKYNFLKKKKN